ncbi:hypothetical protein P3W53_06735 [Pseudomonas denitrificans (nom. rej.)]|nr:hypothetical protein [Pseudomonas denitrificans (nom. rej.)]
MSVQTQPLYLQQSKVAKFKLKNKPERRPLIKTDNAATLKHPTISY